MKQDLRKPHKNVRMYKRTLKRTVGIMCWSVFEGSTTLVGKVNDLASFY